MNSRGKKLVQMVVFNMANNENFDSDVSICRNIEDAPNSQVESNEGHTDSDMSICRNVEDALNSQVESNEGHTGAPVNELMVPSCSQRSRCSSFSSNTDDSFLDETYNPSSMEESDSSSNTNGNLYRKTKNETATLDYKKANAGAHSVGLMVDGWSNIRNEAVLNFVVTTPKPFLFKIMPTGTAPHTAEYMAKTLGAVIREIGPRKVFGIVTDNAANMKAAWALIENDFDNNIFTYGCFAHSLNLIFTDLKNLTSLKSFTAEAVALTKAIRQSHILSAWVKEKQNELKISCSLKLPVPTRWGSLVLCLQSLLANKQIIKRMAINEEVEKATDATEVIYKVAQKMPDVDEAAVLADVNFIAKEGLFKKAFLWNEDTIAAISPIAWWSGLCSNTALSKLAIRFLELPATSAACERSFSSYSGIHTNKRNRLTNTRASKIVYVAHNLKLMAELQPSESSSSESIAGSSFTVNPALESEPEPMIISNSDQSESVFESDEEEASDEDEFSESNNSVVLTDEDTGNLMAKKKALTAAERQRRCREKRKNDPEKVAEVKRKDLERYHARKKLVANMSVREHQIMKRKWQQGNKKRREKKQMLENLLLNTPTPSTISEAPEISSSSCCATPTPSEACSSRGRKKVRRDRTKLYRDNIKLQDKIDQLEKKVRKYKKRLQRKSKKYSSGKVENNSQSENNYRVLCNAIKERYKAVKSRMDSKEEMRLLRLYEDVSTDDEAESYSASDESFRADSDLDNRNTEITDSDDSEQTTDANLQESGGSHEPNDIVQELDMGWHSNVADISVFCEEPLREQITIEGDIHTPLEIFSTGSAAPPKNSKEERHQQLKFLDGIPNHRIGGSNVSRSPGELPNSEEDVDLSLTNDDCNEPTDLLSGNTENEKIDAEPAAVVNITESSQKSRKQIKIGGKRKKDDDLLNIWKERDKKRETFFKSIVKKRKHDDVEAFCHHIGEVLRNLPPVEKAEAKKHLSMVLSDYEIKAARNACATQGCSSGSNCASLQSSSDELPGPSCSPHYPPYTPGSVHYLSSDCSPISATGDHTRTDRFISTGQ
ncbi:unnamed protein product [Diabrotica balteata]|uniref:Uncharacterized protein n=1 Tax=Diabrotica balteata TaxID=107213 RepID=A0A9N9XKY1_DIABA|nr:unnamed protein product [Diabrotica balteata]